MAALIEQGKWAVEIVRRTREKWHLVPIYNISHQAISEITDWCESDRISGNFVVFAQHDDAGYFTVYAFDHKDAAFEFRMRWSGHG